MSFLNLVRMAATDDCKAYGIGQSLLMLPADIVGTYVERLPIFANYNGNDPSVRNIVVSFSTNMLLNVLTALVCFRLLRQFHFFVNQAVAGGLALLVLTTHLHYTQNMMENNYICLLSLTGFSYQYEWLRNGSRRALLIGAGAFGLNLLTRLRRASTCWPAASLSSWFCGLRELAECSLAALPCIHRGLFSGLSVFWFA